ARHVEVVRRLVEKQEIGVAAQSARERGAGQLTAGEGGERAVEVGVDEAEAANDRARALAPVVAARVLKTRLRVRVAPERRFAMVAVGHRRLEPAQLLLRRDEVGRAREDVLTQRELALERRALVVESDAGPLLERELAALELGLADEDADQRRLAGPVRPGKPDADAAPHLEGS